MTDITLNGRRLTPEQSSWLVGSLQHERAYCSTPGELLELLSHPTPPPAPEVEAMAAVLPPDLAAVVARVRTNSYVQADTVTLCDAVEIVSESRNAMRDAWCKAAQERDAATQRAEAAERELAISRAETENVRTNLICVMDERGAAERALQRISDIAPPVGKPHGPYDAANAVTFAREALGVPLRDPTPSAPFITAPDITELTELARAFRNGDAPYESRVYASLLDRAAEELCSRSTPTPPAAPSEMARRLQDRARFLNGTMCADHVQDAELMTRAAAALCAPGSEAPMVAALRDRVRELKYALRDVFSEAREHIPEDLAKDARAQIDFDESTLTPLPASPAAGKEAM